MTVWSDEDEDGGELVWLTGNARTTTVTTPAHRKVLIRQSQWTEYLGIVAGGQDTLGTVTLQQVAPELPPPSPNVFSRPAIPYSQIIRQAMEGSPRGKLLLREIYEWFEAFHPYYTQENKGWKNSVRHTLSANRQFLRLPNEKDFNNKGSEWCLVESAVGQAFLKHRPELSTPQLMGPLSMWPQPLPDCMTTFNNSNILVPSSVGPLKRAKSTDVFWSGGSLVTADTPAHLLGMTPNPDFSFGVGHQPGAPAERRHTRSLSVGDTPMLQSPTPPPDTLSHDDDVESLELCDLDNIMYNIA